MKILVAGDFCPRGRVVNKFEKKDYSLVLSEVRKITSQVDFSIVNLECPVVTGDAKPILKTGPNLKCSIKGIEAIQYAGFDCVTLANNHFLDYGSDGVSETITTLNTYGIGHVGGGMNLTEASKILYKDIAGQRLAIVNCCEHEFSIANEDSAGSNPLNPIAQFYSIQEAKRNSDWVLVIVHGGHEHFQLPSRRMVETYRFFIDSGADAVVNHHQHCFSGYDIYKNKPIFYGLGNFCFDNDINRSGLWTEGYAVTLDFSTDNIVYKIHPYCQCAEEPIVKLLPDDAFNKKIEELNAIISDLSLLGSVVNKYYSSSSEWNSRIFEPIESRLFLSARYRGLLPSLISRKRFLAAYNYIYCESHCDKLKYWFKKHII